MAQKFPPGTTLQGAGRSIKRQLHQNVSFIKTSASSHHLLRPGEQSGSGASTHLPIEVHCHRPLDRDGSQPPPAGDYATCGPPIRDTLDDKIVSPGLEQCPQRAVPCLIAFGRQLTKRGAS